MTTGKKLELLEKIIRELVEFVETEGLPEGTRRILKTADAALLELDADREVTRR